MDDVTEEYRTSLVDLTQNSKPLINMLTMLAEDNENHASKIVEVIETHLQQVEANKKLPTLYLIDSIIKNLPKSTYPSLFSHNIVNLFCSMFEQVDEKTRQCMFKVRQTWNQHFPPRKLYALDVRVNNIDHAWPLTTPASSITSSIHVNPRFLAQKEDALPLPDVPPVEEDEAEMRRQLIAKQAELLKLQQKRLELELKETEARLSQQKINTSGDLFVGVENPKTSTVTPSSHVAPVQGFNRDPRLQKDPRLASKDPRVCRDPRIRNRPTQAELLPNPNDVQPILTFFGPLTNQPFNQSEPVSDEPPVLSQSSPLEPPDLGPADPGIPSHSIPSALPHPVPKALPIMSEFRNQNNQAIPSIKEEPIEEKHSPRKEFKPKPTTEIKKEKIHKEEVQIKTELKTSPLKSKAQKNENLSPKEKKPKTDPRKIARESRSKDSKERESKDSKPSTNHLISDKNRPSSNEGKRNESQEKGKSRGKNDHDTGKSPNYEEKDKIKSKIDSSSERSKGKRIRGDSEGESRKKIDDRNGQLDSKDKGRTWNDSRNRRSRSPRPTHERSKSPSKDNEKLSKSKTRGIKNRDKIDTKSDVKKAPEEPCKTDSRRPISSLPRIPKRTATDIDERMSEKDRDDRRSSSSNKRDLDERPDYRGRESERHSKKPRISQEKDVPLGTVQVHTKMDEDISNLFGNEDQDYRHSDTISPRGGGQGGWAKYKADHSMDYDNRRTNVEDVDHRRDAKKTFPMDTDYRPGPYNRPPARSPVYNVPPSDDDVPLELRLENRENILRTMEMRRKSGEISQEDHQSVLRSLSEYDSIQEQKRLQNSRPDPPHLEPEFRSQNLNDDNYPQRPTDKQMEYHSPMKDSYIRPKKEPMEYSPRRDPRYRPHDDRPPLYDDSSREGSHQRNFPLERALDFDKRDRQHDERQPHGRPRELDGPDRHPPSLLGPGPGHKIRPDQDIDRPDRESAATHYDIDHRKPPQLERGPIDRRGPEIEPGRSPVERPREEKPSLLGPGPAPLKDTALHKHENVPKKEPVSHDSVKQEVHSKYDDSKLKGTLAVGAMMQTLKAENTPDNSQDAPIPPPIIPKPIFDPAKDDKVPKLLPKPVYDPSQDDRWTMPGGVKIKDGALNIFPEGTEEIVINGQPFPIKLGGPKIIVPFRGEQLEVFLDSTRRMVYINGTAVYKLSDPVNDVRWGPGPNQCTQVFYHGNPRNLWIDGFLYNLRIDAPPKIIKLRDKNHTILIDGRNGMLLIDKKEFGTFGGKPRFLRLDNERVELRFTPPLKNIVIDGEQCQIRLDRKIPFIIISDVARGIRFDGPPREVIINNQKFLVPTDRAIEVRIDNVNHMVAFGGPSHEIIIDGIWYELQFNGPLREITSGNHKLHVGLPTPPPDVKILDPIENQKLKDMDKDNVKSVKDGRGNPDDRNSPLLGQIGQFPQKKPPSLLDIEVKRPPGLKSRSRSPDHRDRRRRSPHRSRRSPDRDRRRRRSRSPVQRDGRRRHSPQTESRKFDGPQDSMPPFGPGPRGPPFNQGGPNQPFPQNQQFPAPIQGPFPQGPNQRFPPGPNQQPFMPGPNQQFPSGGPNQFQPRPNQPLPQGQVPIHPFPQGPVPPIHQDTGSQGPHPMFQQVPNNQGQPMQPNMPVISQPMAVSQAVSGLPVPMMPAVSMMQPGPMVSQPMMIGNVSQPQDMAQPPTLIPQVPDVSALLQKLIKVGLISGSKEESKEKVEEKPKEPEPESPKVKVEEENREDKGPKRKPVRVKPEKLEKIPNLTDMKMSTLKQQFKGVIQRMYSGIQCTSCGTRFMSSQTTLYREHLDWHFRQNQREKKESRISRYRSWFYELNDWLDYEEVGDSEERARTNLFEKQSQEPAEKEPVLPQGENIVHCPAATGEDNADACVVCGDVFEQFFDEESEEWHLKNALRSDGKTYHPVCYEDAQESTPKEDPGANPMLLQIQKELGYVPADTVVSFPAANVISVSQHDHTPKDISPDTPPPEDDVTSEVKEESTPS